MSTSLRKSKKSFQLTLGRLEESEAKAALSYLVRRIKPDVLKVMSKIDSMHAFKLHNSGFDVSENNGVISLYVGDDIIRTIKVENLDLRQIHIDDKQYSTLLMEVVHTIIERVGFDI